MGFQIVGTTSVATARMMPYGDANSSQICIVAQRLKRSRSPAEMEGESEPPLLTTGRRQSPTRRVMMMRKTARSSAATPGRHCADAQRTEDEKRRQPAPSNCTSTTSSVEFAGRLAEYSAGQAATRPNGPVGTPPTAKMSESMCMCGQQSWNRPKVPSVPTEPPKRSRQLHTHWSTQFTRS